MGQDITRFMRSGAQALAPEEALRAGIATLIGVSVQAQAALASINVNSVFDLAASRVFADAAALLTIAEDPTRAEARLNVVARDVAEIPPGIPVRELANRPVATLRALGEAAGPTLAEALDVATVRDLALWPPYTAAKAILAAAFFPEQAPGFDADAPPDLLPRSGIYPTERVFYRKLVLDAVPERGQTAQPIEEAGPIDLEAASGQLAGFGRLATGALLTFSQSWFSEGLTLGSLLHSTSLAPGESTRIAVIDWSRRSRAAASEDISESELLSNTMTHSRALSEVTSATAREFQSGRSHTTSESTSAQGGGAFGLDLGPLAIGGSGGASTNTTDVVTTASSFGARDLAANYAQNINDRSQQNASSVRNRRASIVREVSQAEHEEISTRVITNYNHMHALSIHYYEVVQAFRTTTQLERAERCLFIPAKLLDFHNQSLVDRWRLQLADAALTGRARRQLTVEYGVVEIIPNTPRITPAGMIITGEINLNLVRSIDRAAISDAGTPASPAADGSPPTQPAPAPAPQPNPPAPAAPDYRRAPVNSPATLLALKGWDIDQLNRIGWATGRVLMRPGSDSVFVSDDALLVGFSLREGQAARFAVRLHDGHEVEPGATTETAFSFSSPVAITAIESIALQFTGQAELRTGLVLQLNVLGTVMPLDVPILLKPMSVPREVIKFGNVRAASELVDHLAANRLHYTQAVLRALDSASIAALLAGYTYRGLPLSQLVDAAPVAVTANFLVFKVNVEAGAETEDSTWSQEQDDWQAWLERRGLAHPAPRSEIIPLPSGGVFAEAVLGRYNAAEKIDLTRFWNWQDSPIPITAPEISPVQAGSRAQSDEIRPGQLSQPILNIQTPTALPDPTGVGAIVTAIQQGNMFRDMSGLVQTAALAQAALRATAQGATAAGEQAGQNMKTVVDAQTERMRIAAQLAAQMLVPGAGLAGAQPPGKGTVTERGGELNVAKSIDAEAASSGAGDLGTAPSSDAAGGSSDVLTDGEDGSEGPAAAPGSTELQRTFRAQRDGPGAGLAAPLVRTMLADFTPSEEDPDSGVLLAQAFKPRSKGRAAGAKPPRRTPRATGSAHAKIRVRLYVPTFPGMEKGWIIFQVGDEDGNLYRFQEHFERLSEATNYVQTDVFNFPFKKPIYILTGLVPFYKAELDEGDLSDASIVGDYRGVLKPGKSVYEFELLVAVKDMTITRSKDITFDAVLEELGISRFHVWQLSAENKHDANGETIAFVYRFKYIDRSKDLEFFPRP